MADAPTAPDRVRHLAGAIGPRGPTTDGERPEAAYAAVGVPSLSIAGLTPEGTIPVRRTVGDVVARVDAGVLVRGIDSVGGASTVARAATP